MRRSELLRILAVAALAPILGLAAAAPANAAAVVSILNQDGPGEGLNDPSPYSGPGGNDAATLGEARLRAVEFAAAVWANALSSDVPILVGVSFDPLGGTASSATLGLGGPEGVFRDFAGAPRPATWYASALGDKLAGLDLDGGAGFDIGIIVNSDVDGGVVLGSSRFYYGFDGNPPGQDVDFVSVAVHELGHGLGFVELLDQSTGAKLLGYDDAYMLHLESHNEVPPDFPSMSDAQRLAAFTAAPDTHWTGANVVALTGGLSGGVGAGGHLEMYAPGPNPTRSSLSHFSDSVTPDEFMEPFYTGTELSFDLVLALFADLGWGTAPICEGGVLP